MPLVRGIDKYSGIILQIYTKKSVEKLDLLKLNFTKGVLLSIHCIIQSKFS